MTDRQTESEGESDRGGKEETETHRHTERVYGERHTHRDSLRQREKMYC